MRVEFNIAHRLSKRHNGVRAGIMERVAVVATAVSLAVIVVTLSVVIGFKQDLNEMLSGATSDVVVTSPQSRGTLSSVGIERNKELESIFDHDHDIERFTAYTAKEGVLKSDDNIVGVVLKGIDTLYNTHFFEQHLTEGAMPRIGNEPRSKDIVMSRSVADRMSLTVGDRVEMIFVDENSEILRDRFALTGIFETGVDVIDMSIVLTDMRNVARLDDGDPTIVTGYELWLSEGADTAKVAARLNDNFDELFFDTGINAEAFTLQQIFPDIYGWLATHDLNALVVVVIMTIVALLNIITSLLIIVLEQRRTIGILRSMGATRGMVMRLFIFRALLIILRGVTWGSIIGIAICVTQHLCGIIPLPADGYMLTVVPTALCWDWWLATVAITSLVCLAFMVLPALLTTKITPAEAIKFD